MTDIVVDSSVAAKWVLPEQDSERAISLLETATRGDRRLIVLDLVFSEVANAIWQRLRMRRISDVQAIAWVTDLLRFPLDVELSKGRIQAAMQIAVRYNRAVYDALFVALADERGLPALTADEPLYNAVHTDFPRITLFRDWQDG